MDLAIWTCTEVEEISADGFGGFELVLGVILVVVDYLGEVGDGFVADCYPA